jgi:hypothetical protein
LLLTIWTTTNNRGGEKNDVAYCQLSGTTRIFIMKTRKPLSHLIENWENVVCRRDDENSSTPIQRCRRITEGSPRADETNKQTTTSVNDNGLQVYGVQAVTPPKDAPVRSSTEGGEGASTTYSASLPTKAGALLDIEGAVRRILRAELCSSDPDSVARGLAKLANGCGGMPVPDSVETAVKDRYEQVVRVYTQEVVKQNGGVLVLQAMQQHAQCVNFQTMGCRVLSRLTGGHCEETARAVTHAISNVVPRGVSFILRVMRVFVESEELQVAGLATILNTMLCDDTQWESVVACDGIAYIVETLLRHPSHPIIQTCGCNILCLPDVDDWLREVAAASSGLSCVIRGLRVGLDDANLLFNGLGALVHFCDTCDSGSAIIDAGGLEVVIAVMRHHAGDSGLQLAGLEAMCLITETDYQTSLPLMAQFGGVQATIHAMRVCTDQPDVQYNACSLLSILCRTHRYRALVLQAGGRAAVTAASGAFGDDDEVQHRARQVMKMLSSSP